MATHRQQYTEADVDRTNVLKIGMEVVVCGVERCTVKEVTDVVYME